MPLKCLLCRNSSFKCRSMLEATPHHHHRNVSVRLKLNVLWMLQTYPHRVLRNIYWVNKEHIVPKHTEVFFFKNILYFLFLSPPPFFLPFGAKVSLHIADWPQICQERLILNLWSLCSGFINSRMVDVHHHVWFSKFPLTDVLASLKNFHSIYKQFYESSTYIRLDSTSQTSQCRITYPTSLFFPIYVTCH